MTTKPIKIPGPDHPNTIEPNTSRVVVTLAGQVIADTREALTLREASYPAVQYVPRKDVDMTLPARSNHETYCPYKGDASPDQGLCRLLSRPRRCNRRTAAQLIPGPALRQSCAMTNLRLS